jgi:hypothetical protein
MVDEAKRIHCKPVNCAPRNTLLMVEKIHLFHLTVYYQ